MTLKLERRTSFGWPSTSGGGVASPRNGVVAHYDGSNQGLAGKAHSACRAYWKQTRRFHMGASRGWSDIGYSYAVCPHGVALEGRGWNRSQAAQPGGNSTWYSVTFMSGPSEQPTAAQLKAFRELRAWLMGRGVRSGVRYHGQFISTSCAGPILNAMVLNGSIIKGSVDGGGPVGGGGGGSVLRRGDSGAAVLAVQNQLVYLGYNLGSYGADGQFGADTERAVRAFQKAHGLDDDGAVGDKTRAALDAAVKKAREDVPDHNRYSKSKAQKLPKEEWTTVEFDASSQKPKAGGGLFSVAFGDVQYSATAAVRLSGLAPGDEYQTRFFEVEEKGGKWTRVRSRGIAEHFHGEGDAYNTGAQNGRLSGKRRLRLEVKQWTSDNAELVSAEVDPLTWEK